MSRRFFHTTMPIDHVNGKMSRVSQKVANATNSEPSANAFYYGYRKDGKSVSRFGLREIPRNLTANPYTTAEQGNKEEFRQSVQNAKEMFRNADYKQQLQADFEKSTYSRFFNYCLALCRQNGGQKPPLK